MLGRVLLPLLLMWVTNKVDWTTPFAKAVLPIATFSILVNCVLLTTLAISIVEKRDDKTRLQNPGSVPLTILAEDGSVSVAEYDKAMLKQTRKQGAPPQLSKVDSRHTLRTPRCRVRAARSDDEHDLPSHAAVLRRLCITSGACLRDATALRFR